jgi:thiol-disulfide isomerase/thioredoxin
MKELSKQEVDGLLQFNRSVVLLYFFTPLCGTCKVATSMLQVLEQALPDLPIYRCNVNLLSAYALKWKLTSVPCLVILEKDRIKRKLYAFQSVEFLYHQISEVRGR